MSFRDCLQSAVEQGAVSREEAEALQSAFDSEFAQARLGLGDEAAAAAARDKLARDLAAEAAEKRRRALLQDGAQRRLAEYVQGYRNLQGQPDVFDAVLNVIEHHGMGGTSSIAGRQKAIVALAHGELADFMNAFRRNRVTGRRHGTVAIDDVVREALGAPTGKPEVKAMADAMQGVFESLRQRFNAAGGAIGRIEGGYLPQDHNARALLTAGRDRWKDFIRPRLDLDRMRDPLTGERLTPERLEQSLDAAFDAVTTDGWSRREPAARAFGRGALAGQRAEHRFLHFATPDDWLAYNREFGSGEPLKAIFGHINGMARDIAALETLGPNPNATMEWLKQIVQTEAAQAVAGRPSLYNAGSRSAAAVADQLDYIPWRIDSVYQYVRGRRVVSNQVATGFGDLRNLLTSAILGGASVLAATTDPFIDAAARYASGLPYARALGGVVHAFRGATKMDVVRSGVIWDDFLHIMGDEARYAGTLGGSEWSRWLAERTVTLSGLEPLTQARRHVFAREFEATLGDAVGQAFDQLNPYLRRTMEGYGLDRTAWDAMRAVDVWRPKPGSAGLLRPVDIANAADGPALPQLQKLLGIDATDAAAAAEQARAGMTRIAEQYLEMILGQTERAVPTGVARARAFVTGAAPRGTVFGEILESGLQFKSFGLSFTAMQLQQLQMELHQGAARGAAYAGAVAIGMTLGGGLAMQLRHMAAGRDPQPMDDPRFWMQAMMTGGGFGIIGDFLFADVSRHGHSLQEALMGPATGFIADTARLTVGNIQELMTGRDTKAGREATNFIGRYTPVLSSLWYTRAAYRRILLDQLQYLLDPEAHRAFREQENRLRRDTGQEFWWRPGEVAPARMPATP